MIDWLSFRYWISPLYYFQGLFLFDFLFFRRTRGVFYLTTNPVKPFAQKSIGKDGMTANIPHYFGTTVPLWKENINASPYRNYTSNLLRSSKKNYFISLYFDGKVDGFWCQYKRIMRFNHSSFSYVNRAKSLGILEVKAPYQMLHRDIL